MKNTYYVFSGKGDRGRWSEPIRTTEQGIKNRLTRERCGGERWAYAYLLMTETISRIEHLALLNDSLYPIGDLVKKPPCEEDK